MENEKDIINLSYTKNLSKQSFNSTFNVQVDSKVNIKTILNVSCCIFDEKVETASGKAVVSGKFCIKVLYLDTDNITNTITDNQPFNETILDNSITSDCHIDLANITVLTNPTSNDGNLKVECVLSFTPMLYLNLAMKNLDITSEDYVAKKSTFNTFCMANKIKQSFNHTSNMETRDNISKILFFNSTFCPYSVTTQDGYATIEGKIFTKVIYETTENDNTQIKELNDFSTVKTDVEIENLSQNSILDLNFRIDNSYDNISIDQDDNINTIIIENKIKICGVELKQVSVDIFEDLFSVYNEIELTKSEREYIENINIKSINEIVVGETNLNKDEPAIDEIVTNSNVETEITNSYIKNNTLHIEGIITSTLIYIDENKEYQNKQLETPFIINTKIEMDNLCSNHINIVVSSTKTRVRRGTVIDSEYELFINVCLYKFNSKEILDNLITGKTLDFSQYDYQIYIAKQNETMWELCKRIKCYPDNLNTYNKNLPSQFVGGEKIIIKR